MPFELSEHVSLAGYGTMLAALSLGATVQGTIGFGAALIAVPAIALVAPDALPTAMVIAVGPLTWAMALRERQGVDWSGVRWIMGGRVPGAAAGAWLVSVLASSTLSVLAGGAVLLATLSSVLSPAVPLTRSTKSTAGFASGVMGTATSIGGPPLALLYQHSSGQVLRSTLAANFVFGNLISVVMLAAAGEVRGWQVVLAVLLMPGLLVGLSLSTILAPRLNERWLRPAVLVVVAITAVAAIYRGLGS